MGSREGETDEQPVHVVNLGGYWIMHGEVTNGQYAQCVNEGTCTAPNNSRWAQDAYSFHPVTAVSWDQAAIYAAWAGGRLPTEAEWEKAARGASSFTYPWGEQPPDPLLLNHDNTIGDTTPSGAFPDGVSPYGAVDMAGNVWEWTSDWYADGYYSSSPDTNPSGPTLGGVRVVRGGAFESSENYVRTSFRGRYAPNAQFGNLGFRVVIPAQG